MQMNLNGMKCNSPRRNHTNIIVIVGWISGNYRVTAHEL